MEEGNEMSWNYRILAHEDCKEITLCVHRVYYRGDQPAYYATTPAIVTGSNVEEIRREIIYLKAAHKKPVLWAGDKFPQIYKP